MRETTHERTGHPRGGLPLRAVWGTIAITIPIVVVFLTTTLAIDLAYQVRAGAHMLDTARVLDVDTFTFTVRGQPWVNQQWGAQVIFAALYRLGGWNGLTTVHGFLLGAIMGLTFLACRANGASARSAALLSLGGWMVGIWTSIQLRPQLLGIVLFAACVWILTNREVHPRWVWFIPPLVLLWSNLHGSFPLALVLLGLAWLEDRRAEPRRSKELSIVLAVSAGVTLVNPFGWGAWLYIYDLSTHPAVRGLGEWSPTSVSTESGYLFFGSFLATAAFLARRGRATGWVDLLRLGLFAALAILSIRNIVWWSIVAPVVIAGQIRDQERSAEDSRSVAHLILVLAMVGLVVATLPVRRGVDPVSGGPATLVYAPERLVAAARDAVPPGSRAFVSELYASWTEFSAPALPVAVDPRLEIFPEHVWDEYNVVSEGRPGWSDILDRWGVDVLILHPAQAEGLLEIIDQSAGWCPHLEHVSGSVYVRC